MSLALTRDWNYDDQPQFGLGVMDLRLAPTNTDGDDSSRDPAFFTYIQRMRRMSKPNFSEANVWLWIHESNVRARQSADFVKRFMPVKGSFCCLQLTVSRLANLDQLSS